MSTTVFLTEYRDYVADLTREDALFVATRLKKKISIRREVSGSKYILNPGQYAGVVQLPSGRRLESRPKVPVSSLLYMLAIASELPSPLLDEWAGYDRFDEMLEFVVSHFVDLVDDKIANGLYRTYIDQEENLPAVRGKIVIDTDIRMNAITRHLTFCRYGEFTWDIPENQIIRQTVHYLTAWGFSSKLRSRLWQLDSQLQEVTPKILPITVLSTFTYHRLNADYEPIHNLCQLFLSAASISELAGETRFPTFLIDMNKLFEAFVTQVLRRHLPSDIVVRAQRRRKLDDRGTIRMRLDLEFKRRGRILAVGDCKYKRQSNEDSKAADVYQVLAYAIGSNVSRGFLVYPSHEKSTEDDLRVRNTDVTIWRIPINLGVDPQSFLQECARFAGQIGAQLHHPPDALPAGWE